MAPKAEKKPAEKKPAEAEEEPPAKDAAGAGEKKRKRKKSKPAVDAAGPMQINAADAERAIGYTFRNPALLEQSLTHPSASASPGSSYKRLKILGDSALGLAFTKHLYFANPGLGRGDLSSLRAANVSTVKLARAAVRHGLYRFVRRNSQELDHMIEKFVRAEMRGRAHEGTGSTKGAPKLLADVVQAVAGAVYTDSGWNLEAVWQVFRRILSPIFTMENLDEQPEPVQGLPEAGVVLPE